MRAADFVDQASEEHHHGVDVAGPIIVLVVLVDLVDQSNDPLHVGVAVGVLVVGARHVVDDGLVDGDEGLDVLLGEPLQLLHVDEGIIGGVTVELGVDRAGLGDLGLGNVSLAQKEPGEMGGDAVDGRHLACRLLVDEVGNFLRVNEVVENSVPACSCGGCCRGGEKRML